MCISPHKNHQEKISNKLGGIIGGKGHREQQQQQLQPPFSALMSSRLVFEEKRVSNGLSVSSILGKW